MPSTLGLPPLLRDFQRHQALKPARCQPITVSGRMMVTAPAILGQIRHNQTNNTLSKFDNFGLFGPSAAGCSTDGEEQRSQPSGVRAIGSSSRHIPIARSTKPAIGFDHDLILFTAAKSMDGVVGRHRPILCPPTINHRLIIASSGGSMVSSCEKATTRAYDAIAVNLPHTAGVFA